MAENDDHPNDGEGSESATGSHWKFPLQDVSAKGKESEDRWKKGWGSYKDKAAAKDAGDTDKSKLPRSFETGPVYDYKGREHVWKEGTYGKHKELSYKAGTVQGEVQVGKFALDLDKKKFTATVVNAKVQAKGLEVETDVVRDIEDLLGLGEKEVVLLAPLAARPGDMTAHGTPLHPGPGSSNVFIGGRPAWRAGIDFHICPLRHPEHVGGMVKKGAKNVFINYQMACRQGDHVVEAGGRTNQIVGGCARVFIGDPAGSKDEKPDIVSIKAKGEFASAEAHVTAKADVDLQTGKAQLVGEVGATASLLSGSVDGTVHIPIPFTHYHLNIGGKAEGAVLSAGAKLGGSIKTNQTDPATGKKKLFEATGGGYVGLAILGGGLGGSLGVEED